MRRAPRLTVLVSLVGLCASVHALRPPSSVSEAREAEQAGRIDEALDLYESVTRANPFDGQAWYDYGFALHRQKRWAEAAAAWGEAERIGFRVSGTRYNIACAHAMNGNPDEALAWLEKALQARFAEQETLEQDTDLDSLRALPRFAELTGLTSRLPAPPAAGREAQWAWDLAFVQRRMEQLHWDLYGVVSREEFTRELESLKARVPDLTDEQVRMEVKRIVARVGDGHTNAIVTPAEMQAAGNIPVHMFLFPDGLHIIGADPVHAALVGARVERVGGLDVDEAIRRTKAYASVDNDMGYLAWAPALLRIPIALRAIGATTEEASCAYTLRLPDGTQREVTLAAKPSSGGGFLNPTWDYLHESLEAAPLFVSRPDEPNWITPLPEAKAVYFNFSSVRDTPSGTLAQQVERVQTLLRETNAENLIIDMRFNGGGNTGLTPPLLKALITDPSINRHGHLWVLIGRDTFSAAQNTVNMIEQMTDATFVGEPTGSRPCFIGESTSFTLPFSQIRVICSSRYWQYGDSTDTRQWVAPQIYAPLTFEAYSQGRDPAMEAVLKAIKVRENETALR